MQVKSVKPACILNYNKNDRNEIVSITIYEIKTQLSCLGFFVTSIGKDVYCFFTMIKLHLKQNCN